tara:strand:+ start:8099 stop:8464 length:366 start_codon:yes stop_codon:yes gene_type:complete
MTLIDEADGKIKLDRLEGPEKRSLIEAFVKSEPLSLIWQAALLYEGPIKDVMESLQTHPDVTLFFKLLDEEIIECPTIESREKWFAELKSEMSKRRNGNRKKSKGAKNKQVRKQRNAGTGR